jgi:hypothetical protein
MWQRAGGRRRVLFKGDFSSVFLLVASLSERVGEPLETLVETITGGSTGGLDVLLGGKA